MAVSQTMITAPRSLLPICLGLGLASCSPPEPENLREADVPKDAVVVSIAVPEGLVYRQGLLDAFWLADGLPDAPGLQLKQVASKGRYSDSPITTALELRCEPFGRGVMISSGIVRLGMAQPKTQPGDQLVLKADALTVAGPTRIRNYGSTDTAIPGTLIPADAVDLTQLAKAKTLTVAWGERTVSAPAPPAEMFSAFASECGRALRFAQWSAPG